MFKFDPDNKWWRLLDKTGTALIVNLLWLACCAPIITIGPATAAMYNTVRLCLLKGEGHVMATFFTTFRDNLRQACGLGLLGDVMMALMGASLLAGLSQGPVAIGGTVLVGGLLCCCVLFWAVPLATRFNNTAMAHLRHGLVLGLAHLGSSILLLAAWVGMGVGIWRFFPLIFVLPVALLTAWVWHLERLFGRLGYLEGSTTSHPEGAGWPVSGV